MAVTEWYFGIPAQFNFMNSLTFAPQANKHTYIAGYRFYTSSGVGGASFRVTGKNAASLLNPGSAELVNVLSEPLVESEVKNFTMCNIKLENGDSICFTKFDPVNAAGTVVAELITVEVDLQPAGRSPQPDLNLEDLRQYLKAGKFTRRVGWIAPASTAEQPLEYSVGGKQIIPPILRTVPAVATELNLVSTSALDTLAGTGMRKAQFQYWDASGVEKTTQEIDMNGVTPVDIIADHADVAAIGKLWGTAWGSTGVNVGNILVQEDA